MTLTRSGATVNVRTQEAIEVLAVCLYHKEKSRPGLTRSGAAFAEVTEVARTGSGRSGPTAASFHCCGSNRAWTRGEDEPRPLGLALA